MNYSTPKEIKLAVWLILLVLVAVSESKSASNAPNEIIATDSQSGDHFLYDTNQRVLHIRSTNTLPVDAETLFNGKQNTDDKSLEKIARISVPILFEEKDGEYVLRERKAEDEPKSLTLNSDKLMSYSRYLTGDLNGTNVFSLPVMQLTIDWDAATGEYRVDRFGVGLFDEKLWLMHEVGETEDDPGRYGIQLKKKW